MTVEMLSTLFKGGRIPKNRVRVVKAILKLRDSKKGLKKLVEMFGPEAPVLKAIRAIESL